MISDNCRFGAGAPIAKSRLMLFCAALLATGLATALPLSVRAQSPATVQTDPQKEAAVKDLLAALNFSRMMRDATEAMKGLIGAQMPQLAEQVLAMDQRVPQEQKAKLRGHFQAQMKSIQPRLDSHLSAMLNNKDYLADNEAAMTAFYLNHFTLDEIKELTAFHRTPTGQKALLLTPQAMNEVMKTIMPKWSPRWQEQMVSFVRAEIAQMQPK